MNIEDFRKINQPENIVITMHGQKRMHERGILLRDVINAIDHGDIIEEYPTDFPFPSCLILGISVAGRYLHVVVSMDAGHINLIITYFPDPDEWEPDMKTRKERL